MDKREFVIDELMKDSFIEYFSDEVVLEEMEESGKTLLKVLAANDTLLVIRNVDKKGTELKFMKADSKYSMFKRVDHIIFRKNQNNQWILHLIEMKSSVNSEKWVDIKGKFRASYLLAQGIAGMLEIPIYKTVLYTTYENVSFGNSITMPSARRVGTGRRPFKLEWQNGRVGLNFGTILDLKHEAVKVEREDTALRGELLLSH